MMKHAGFGLFALAAMGCSGSVGGDAKVDHTATQQSPIIGGEDDPNDPSVVAVYAKVPGAD
jgi:hypothetical protein